MKNRKFLKVADVREVLDKLGREEITYCKMVELLNIKINKQLHIDVLSNCCCCNKFYDEKGREQGI